jgi:hypothetical protein
MILERSNVGNRPVGKPGKRCVNAVETDNRETSNEKQEKEFLDRQVWRRYFKEAKARLRGVAPKKKKMEKENEEERRNS